MVIPKKDPILICLLSCLLTVFSITAPQAAPLHMLTDDYPPYSFKENGGIAGICMDIVREALKDSSHTFQVQLYPFARAYVTTRDEKNIFEFCVARTPERETSFHWIGPVGPTNEGLLALAARTDIRIEKDADMGAYKIGTVISDVVDQHLSAMQKKRKLKLDKTSSYRQNMKKLMAGRMDLWAGNLIVGFQLARELGHDPSELRVVHTFPVLNTDLYLVTGKKTDPKLVGDLTRIFQAFVERGDYARMTAAFIKDHTPTESE